MPRKIASKISLASLSLTLAIVLALGTASYLFSRRILHEQIQEKLSFESIMVSHRLEMRLTSINDDMRSMAANPVVVNALVDSTGRNMYIEPFLESYHSHHDFQCLLTLCDFEGRPLVSCKGAPKAKNFSDSSLLDQVIVKELPLARIEETASQLTLLIIHPVFYGATGKAEGMLAIEIPLAPLITGFMPKTALNNGTLFILSNKSGEIWSSLTGQPSPVIKTNASLNLNAPLNQLALTLTVAEETRLAFSSLNTLTAIYLAIGAVVIVLAITISHIIGKQLTIPLHALTKTANQIAEGGIIDVRLDSPGSDEISQLASAFNIMLARLQNSQTTLEARVEERTAQLSDTTQTLNTILENIPIGIAKVIDRKQAWTNYKIEEMFQCSKEEMGCQPTRNLYPSDEAYEVLGREAYPILAQGLVFETEQELVRKDGTHILVRYIGKAMAPGDMSQGTIWLLEDITDRKQSENQIKKLAQELQTILDTLTVSVSFIKNRRVQWANAAHDRIFGYAPEECRGLEPSIFYADEDGYKRVSESYAQLTYGATYTTEVEMKTKDDRLFWCSLTGRAINPDDPQEGSIWMIQDISERKNAEDKLRSFAEMQTVLLREVNHRVKNNLVAIISMLHQEEDLAQRDGRLEYLDRLQEVVWRVSGLLTVHRLLSSSEWNPLPISSLCENVIQDTLKGLPPGRSIELQIAPSEICVDSDQAHYLTMVLNELTTNTIKYAFRDRERGAITVSIASRDDSIEILFHDDGPGFPDAVVQGKFPDNGIGFPLIVGLITKSMGGTITLTNDNGAVARITFPARTFASTT
jgi:PAS domain S-box-containing protein